MAGCKIHVCAGMTREDGGNDVASGRESRWDFSDSENEARHLIDLEMQMQNYDPLKPVITSSIDNRIDANA